MILDENCNKNIKLRQHYCSLCGRYVYYNLGGCSVLRSVTCYLIGPPPDLQVTVRPAIQP
jgi:hypothetical protein